MIYCFEPFHLTISQRPTELNRQAAVSSILTALYFEWRSLSIHSTPDRHNRAKLNCTDWNCIVLHAINIALRARQEATAHLAKVDCQRVLGLRNVLT